jgi:hypothetical protein
MSACRALWTLEFALSGDVKNENLERVARTVLVDFVWDDARVTVKFTRWDSGGFQIDRLVCSPRALLSSSVGISAYPTVRKTCDSLLKGPPKQTTLPNMFSLLITAQHAPEKMNAIIDAWADASYETTLTAK